MVDIGRAPINTDLLVMDADVGGGNKATKKMEFQRIKDLFRLNKLLYTAAGGETEIDVPGMLNAFFSVMWQGVTPLDEYNGALPVPAGKYKPDYAAEKVYFGDALGPTEKVLFLFY